MPAQKKNVKSTERAKSARIMEKQNSLPLKKEESQMSQKQNSSQNIKQENSKSNIKKKEASQDKIKDKKQNIDLSQQIVGQNIIKNKNKKDKNQLESQINQILTEQLICKDKVIKESRENKNKSKSVQQKNIQKIDSQQENHQKKNENVKKQKVVKQTTNSTKIQEQQQQKEKFIQQSNQIQEQFEIKVVPEQNVIEYCNNGEDEQMNSLAYENEIQNINDKLQNKFSLLDFSRQVQEQFAIQQDFKQQVQEQKYAKNLKIPQKFTPKILDDLQFEQQSGLFFDQSDNNVNQNQNQQVQDSLLSKNNLQKQLLGQGQNKYIDRNSIINKNMNEDQKKLLLQKQEQYQAQSRSVFGGLGLIQKNEQGNQIAQIQINEQSQKKQVSKSHILGDFNPNEKNDGGYLPIKLPFFKNKEEIQMEELDQKDLPDKMEMRKQISLDSQKQLKEQIIKLSQNLSRQSDQIENKQVKNDAVNLHNLLRSQNPLLVQMPRTLPFTQKQTKSNQKIGKLLIKKSGKVIMRIWNDKEQSQYTDMEVSQGISAKFYQELVAFGNVPSESQIMGSKYNQISFLGQLQEKIVVTPDLQSMIL